MKTQAAPRTLTLASLFRLAKDNRVNYRRLQKLARDREDFPRSVFVQAHGVADYPFYISEEVEAFVATLRNQGELQ